MLSYIKADLRRYFRGDDTFLTKLKVVISTQGIWATICFRLRSWCNANKDKTFFLLLVMPFLNIFHKMVEISTGISIPTAVKIGKGLYIGHFGGIIIGPKTVIGDYCNISQGVTIGQGGRGKQLSPVIGDRVYLGPGAKVFGGIKIGNDVAIGANAVVLKDLPDKAVAVGIPAVIVSYKGSSDFVIIPQAARTSS